MQRVKFKMVGKYTGIGLEDFKEVIEKENIYFDKTLLIKKLLDLRTKVTLFTRPRRFGKTLTLSMIDNFFNIKKKEENKNLFDGLDIVKTEYIDRLGSNPVIYISFKDVKYISYEIVDRDIREAISRVFRSNIYLLEILDDEEKKFFNDVMYEKIEFKYLEDSLFKLSEYLFRYYNKKVIVLIDEYDTPLVSSFLKCDENEFEFIKMFFAKQYAKVLKNNEYLEFAILTGILRVVKEGIFSGLNHLKVNTIFSNDLSEYFGFTHSEVKDVLKLFNLEDKFKKLSYWYDGYTFGKTKIFNPWSIINYLDEKELKPYWVNTGSDELIVNLFRKLSREDYEKLLNLIDGKEIEVYLSDNISLNIINNPENIWMLLLYAGYLTVSKKIDNRKYIIRMVNKEIGNTITDRFLIATYGSDNVIMLKDILDLFFKGDIKNFERELNKLTKNTYSYYDFENEAMYKLYFITLLKILTKEYIIESEIESGRGRSDLLFYNLNKNIGYLLEFKKSKYVKRTINEAIKQIKDREYELRFKKYGITNYKVYISVCNNKEMYFKKIY